MEQKQGDVLHYRCNTIDDSNTETKPIPRWRHTAAVIRSCDGKEMLIVHGGCTTGGKVLGDMWRLDIDEGNWEKVKFYHMYQVPGKASVWVCEGAVVRLMDQL